MSKNKKLFNDIKTPSIKADLKQQTNTKHNFQKRALNDHQIHRLKFDFAEVQNTSIKKTFCLTQKKRLFVTMQVQ